MKAPIYIENYLQNYQSQDKSKVVYKCKLISSSGSKRFYN